MSNQTQDDFNQDEFRQLLTEWQDHVAIKSTEAHYNAQRYFLRRHQIIGFLTIVFSAFVGASALKDITENRTTTLPIILALSVAGTVLSAIQTFLQDADRGNKHRTTAAGYAAVRRLIAQKLILLPRTRNEANACADEIRNELDKLSKEAPELPEKFTGKFGKKTITNPPSTQ